MTAGLQCDHRRHIPGKGNKRCNSLAVYTVEVIENGSCVKKNLCGKHQSEAFERNDLITKIEFIPGDLCPECGAQLDFSRNIPLCPTGHPIDAKVQKYFTERYAECYPQKIIVE